jgi:uncharacterized Zn-binding protein involved in type VI secretion
LVAGASAAVFAAGLSAAVAGRDRLAMDAAKRHKRVFIEGSVRV